jgi:DNA helicase-2/ATP-dependent DNA helicase PcrA
MQKIEIILGPPGTGKTTTLLAKVEELLSSGVPSEKIAVLTFTRAAATEIIDRSCEKFCLKPRQFPYFRTLHSLAFKSLGLNRKQIMTTEHFIEMSKALGGFDFKHTYDENIERPPIHGGLGDKCLALYSLRKSTKLSANETWSKFAEPDVAFEDFLMFCKMLDTYKEQKFMYDFTDFMDLAKFIPPVEVYIIDEAQDLTAQQWDYVRRISRDAREVYIAGDDDQAIFQWAGADIEQFLHLKGDKQVLPKSYRLSRNVWKVANDISSQIHNRYTKEWSPRDEDGEVNFVRDLYDCPLDQGTWLILARHLYQLEEMEKDIRQMGLPYFIQNRSSLDTPYIKAILHYENLRAGKPKSYNDLLKIAKYIPNFEPQRYDGEKLYGQVGWPWGDRADVTWLDALSSLGSERREYVRSLKRRGHSLLDVPKIRLNTIHSTKGSEADNVALSPDMSRRTYMSFTENPDPELRVWYVAVSRAIHRLFVLEPKTPRYFHF